MKVSGETGMSKSISFGEMPISFISLPLFLIPLPEVVQKLPIEKTDKIQAYVSKLTQQQPMKNEMLEGSNGIMLSLDHFQKNVVEPPINQEYKNIRLELKRSKKKQKKSKPKISNLLFSSKRGIGAGGVVVVEKKIESVDPRSLEERIREKQLDISKTIRRIENFENDDTDEEEEETEEEEEGEEEGEEEEFIVNNSFVDGGDVIGEDWGGRSLFMKDVDGQVMRSLRKKVEVFVSHQKHKRREMHKENQKQAQRHLQGITKKLTPSRKTERVPGRKNSSLNLSNEEENSEETTKDKEKSDLLELPVSPIARKRSISEKLPPSKIEKLRMIIGRRKSSSNVDELENSEIKTKKQVRISVPSPVNPVTNRPLKLRKRPSTSIKRSNVMKRPFDAKEMARKLKKMHVVVDRCIQQNEELQNPLLMLGTYSRQQLKKQRKRVSMNNRNKNSEEEMGHTLLDASKNPYTLYSKKFRGNVNSYIERRRKIMKKKNPFPDIKPSPVFASYTTTTSLSRGGEEISRSVIIPNYNNNNNYKKIKRKKKKKRNKFGVWKNSTSRMYDNEKRYMRSLPKVNKFRRRKRRSVSSKKRNVKLRSRRPFTTSVSSRRGKRGNKTNNYKINRRSVTPSPIVNSKKKRSSRRSSFDDYDYDDDPLFNDDDIDLYDDEEYQQRKKIISRRRPKSAVVRRRRRQEREKKRGVREMLGNLDFLNSHFRRKFGFRRTRTANKNPISPQISTSSRPVTSPAVGVVTSTSGNNNKGARKEVLIEGKEGTINVSVGGGMRNSFSPRSGFNGTIRVCRLSETLKGFKI